MIILGIDQAYNHSGIAVFKDGEYTESFNYKVEKDDDKQCKYDKFYAFVNDMVTAYKPDKVICEKAFCGPNKMVFGLISELTGMIRSVCYAHSVELQVVSTATYRCGQGIKNKKDLAVEFVKSLYPTVEIDDEFDIADAILLARYCHLKG